MRFFSSRGGMGTEKRAEARALAQGLKDLKVARKWCRDRPRADGIPMDCARAKRLRAREETIWQRALFMRLWRCERSRLGEAVVRASCAQG